MKKAIVIYRSKKGTTKKLGSEIGNYLKKRGLQAEVLPVEDCRTTNLSSFDYVFLGCWTKGLMVLAQHPDKMWQSFVRSLKIPSAAKIGLFATYKIASGSMFSRMQKCLPGPNQDGLLKIKSRDGHLPEKLNHEIEQYLS